MSNSKVLLAFLVFILLLFGCNDDVEKTQSNIVNKQVNFTVLASEKTLPINFDDIAFIRETSPFHQFLVRKSVNQSEFDETWSLYGLEQDNPDVDFNKNVVFFIGFFESGSCPSEIGNVELNIDNNTLTVPLLESEGACASDATPKTFVMQVDKKISPKIENLIIIQSNIKTNVPYE